MVVVSIVVVFAALALAFANGANDNSKGVATLIGSGTLPSRRALIYAAVTTFLGSAVAVFVGGELAELFSGKGIVDPSVLQTAAFPVSLGLAAALTVFLATWLGMPISTTHSMVGALVGIGLSAGALHLGPVARVMLLPLLVAPLFALLLAWMLYQGFRRARLSLGVNHQTCVCIQQQFHPVTINADGSAIMAATGLRLSKDQIDTCRQRYDGTVVGVEAQRVLDWSHYITAGAVSFARGLNDTPKIAAIMVMLSFLSPGSSVLLVGIGIAAGGLLAVRRVARTMSYRITDMNDGQAFTANFTTALLVIFASKWGIPVSTTHVSCGSLFGIGAANGRAHWNVIGQVLLAWVTTLPVAALLGWAIWRALASLM